MSIETPQELDALRRVGRVVAAPIAEARRRVRRGMTTRMTAARSGRATARGPRMPSTRS